MVFRLTVTAEGRGSGPDSLYQNKRAKGRTGMPGKIPGNPRTDSGIPRFTTGMTFSATKSWAVRGGCSRFEFPPKHALALLRDPPFFVESATPQLTSIARTFLTFPRLLSILRTPLRLLGVPCTAYAIHGVYSFPPSP